MGHLAIFGPSNQFDLSESTIQSEVQTAMNKWRSAESQLPNVTAQISYQGGFSSARFLNEDTFVRLYPGIPAGVAAVTARGYEDPTCKVINRAWTDFRDKTTWTWGTSPGAQLYTQELMLHEFGHWWRLKHPEDDPRQSCSAYTVMRGIHTGPMYDEVLTNEDIQAVQGLYRAGTLIAGSLTATGGSGYVNLTWEDATVGQGGFSIYRGDNCNGPDRATVVL